MPNQERNNLQIIAEDIDSIRRGLNALKRDCVGILPELKEHFGIGNLTTNQEIPAESQEKKQKPRQTSPRRVSKAPKPEQLAQEPSKDSTENVDDQIDANNNGTSHETIFTREQYRENGFKSLISYLQLNGIANFEEIKQKDPDELREYFSLQLKEPKNDIAKEVEANARDMFKDNYHEEIEDRPDEDYAEDIEEFIREVNESIEINENNAFDSYLDIHDFIEKMRLVAVNSNDELNKLAKKFHQAAAQVVEKQDLDKATPSEVDEDDVNKRASLVLGGKDLKPEEKGKDVGAEVSRVEAEKTNDKVTGNDDKKAKSDKDKKQRKQPFLLRFVGGPVGDLALLAAAAGLGGGAVWVYDHFRGDSVHYSVHDNNGNRGVSVVNSVNCNNKSGSVENNNSSDTVGPDTSIDEQIKRSGDLSQQDAKDILDRADGSLDGILTFNADSNHNYDRSFKQVFGSLGADADELGKLKNYAKEHKGPGQSGDLIQFNTYNKDQNFVADVLTLGARASGTKLPNTTDVAGYNRDESIKLIGLMEAQGQRGQESTATSTAAATTTPESQKSPISTNTITYNATAAVSKTAVPTATSTRAVDLPTKTPDAYSQIKKSQREAVAASLNFHSRFASSGASFIAPIFLMAGPIVEVGSGLKYLNDDEDSKKEAKSKKIRESKS